MHLLPSGCGHVILTASATSNNNINVDANGDLPSLCTSNHLIVVSSVNSSDVAGRGFGTVNIDINAPGEKIYPLLSDIKQWEKWNEYVSVYHNRVAETDMLKADEIAIFLTGKKDSLVTADWQQPSGNKFGNGFTIMGNSNKHSHSTVQWYFDFHVRWYPWEKFQSIVYDQQLGPVMEKSLANLKRIAENSN